jgi:3-hydroxy acid dehydrogenase/malonic semialdehyde reductase
MAKIVMITGATAGIGAACAELFAAQQFDLILAARRKDRLEEMSARLQKQYGSRVRQLLLDVRDKRAVTAALDGLPAEWKKTDILINNAGLCLGLDPIQQGCTDDWDTMIDTNIKGLLYVSRIVSRWMIDQQIQGHIVNLGSIAAKEVYPNGNIYCATKHAVDAISKAMRIDMLAHRIKVTAIHPGPVQTEFAEIRFKGDKERAKKVYQGYQPLCAKDIAETIWFAVTRPAHVNIDDLLIMPAAQATATLIDRN